MSVFHTLLLGATGLTGSLVFQHFVSLHSYLSWVDLANLKDDLELNHYVLVISRSSFDLRDTVKLAFDELQNSDLVEWHYSFFHDDDENDNQSVITYSTRLNDAVSVNINVLVSTIQEPDSTKWAEIIPKRLSTYDGLTNLSVISCLGSTSLGSKKSGVPREWVDKTLNFEILKAVTDNVSISKKVTQYIAVTSFNNPALSKLFPYFKAKQEFESDVKLLLEKSETCNSAIILRPGPLIGKHGSTPGFVTPELDDHLLRSVLKYKKAILSHYATRIKLWQDVGIATRASELVAQISYKVPGARLVGYPVKANDCAIVIASERIANALGKHSSHVKFRIINSQEIDSYKAEFSNSGADSVQALPLAPAPVLVFNNLLS